MAKMAKEGLLHTATEETKYRIKKPHAEVQEETTRGVEIPGHTKVKAAIERLPAMLHQNHTSGCLPCHNCTAKNPQTHWRLKRTGAPPPTQRRQATPPPPGTPLTPTSQNSGAQSPQIGTLPAGSVHSHTYPPCAEFFNLDASAQDSQQDTDIDPDMLTDEGTSAG